VPLFFRKEGFMAQHQMKEGELLDEEGNLLEAGFAYDLVKHYDRNAIKAGKSRIKEWDYYYIGDQYYGIALTIDDNSYMGLVSVSVFDFKYKQHYTKSYMDWLTFGKTNFPSTSKQGHVVKKGKHFSMVFLNENGKRHLLCTMENVAKGRDFSCDISLEETTPHSMVIATPFKKKGHFYYNQKINLLKAKGRFTFGNMTYEFRDDAFGGLDWGRGVWTYSNTWYWSSMNGIYEGRNIAFNLGYGFGDTSQASENMLFLDQRAYKLEDVSFNIPRNKKGKEVYLQRWTFTSKSGDINLIFEPLFDRASNTNALLIQSDQHQVFGRFSGTFRVKGKNIHFENLIGFAEKVKNRW